MSSQPPFPSPTPRDVQRRVILDGRTRAEKSVHIIGKDMELAGFSNNRPCCDNACFRNALISLLINIPAFAGWVVSRNTAVDSHEPSVVSLLERLIRRYWSIPRDDKYLQRSLDTAIELLYDHINTRSALFPPSTSQDPAQLLMHLVNLAYAELSGDILQASEFLALVQTTLVPYHICQRRCDDSKWRRSPPSDWHYEPSLRTQPLRPGISFSGMLQTVFSLDPCLKECSGCGEVTMHDQRRQILNPPEILFLDINRMDGDGHKSGIPVPDILDEIDLRKYLESDTRKQCNELKYRLVGCVSHRGERPPDGHYVSHVQALNGDWKELDDAQVKSSSLKHLQEYATEKGLNQFFPQLLAYVRIQHNDVQKTGGREASAVENGGNDNRTGAGTASGAGNQMPRAESLLPDYEDSAGGNTGRNMLLPTRRVEDPDQHLCHPCPYIPDELHHQCGGVCRVAITDAQIQSPPQRGDHPGGQSESSDQTDCRPELYCGDPAFLNIEILASGPGGAADAASTHGNVQCRVPFYDPATRQPVEVTLELTTADGNRVKVVPGHGPTRTFVFQGSDEA